MASEHVCQGCGKQMRLGLHMPPVKARIIDLIKAAGEIGITQPELTQSIYGDVKRSPKTMLGHLLQINERLAYEKSNWFIRHEGRGPNARWHLVRLGKAWRGEHYGP
jgi:hypothetical protein